MITPDGHFLSATNPTATAEQRDLERLAIRLLDTPEVQAARQQVAGRWQTIVGRENITAEAHARLEDLVEESALNYVLKAVAGDPQHPVVLGHLFSPPHQWFDMKVPGSRTSGADGPDQHYVLIPVEYGTRYEITGQRFAPTPADIPLTLTGNPSLTMTLGSLDLNGIDVDSDGRFTITVGPEDGSKAAVPRNHVQTHPGSMYLFIRECRADWTQVPSAMRVRRLGPPRGDPWTEQQMIRRAASIMVEDVAPIHWFMRVTDALEPNTVPAPFNTGTVGGLVTQSIVFARLSLADDEAFVFTVDGPVAPYHSFALYDFWFRTIDYPTRQTTLTNAQTVPNPDGTRTYVVSHTDPGVANWLDTTGLHELRFVNRSQGAMSRQPATTGRLVKLADLESALPADVPTLDQAQREQALARRQAEFLTRFRTD